MMNVERKRTLNASKNFNVRHLRASDLISDPLKYSRYSALVVLRLSP